MKHYYTMLIICLLTTSTIAIAGKARTSEADASKLPFVGTRSFNFTNGNRTGHIISIKKNGITTIKTDGGGMDFVSTIEYSGKFRNPIKIRDYDIRYLFKNNKVYEVDVSGKFTYDCGDLPNQVNGLCVAEVE